MFQIDPAITKQISSLKAQMHEAQDADDMEKFQSLKKEKDALTRGLGIKTHGDAIALEML